MAGCADLEAFLAFLGLDGVGGRAGQRQHVLRGVLDVSRAVEGSCLRRHDAVTAFRDGLDDRLGITTVQPVTIGQVGEVTAAPGIGTVALGAVVQEEPLADGKCLGVRLQLVGRLAGELGVDGAERGFHLGALFVVLTNGGPATSTLEVTHARVVDQVADGEEGADQVEAHPPAGQGVVGLTDVAVPDVAGGVVRRGSGFPAVCDQNEQTEQQAENGQYDDVV